MSLGASAPALDKQHVKLSPMLGKCTTAHVQNAPSSLHWSCLTTALAYSTACIPEGLIQKQDQKDALLCRAW